VLNLFLPILTQILGTPTKDDLQAMNPSFKEFQFPLIRSYPWSGIFRNSTPGLAIDCISKLLVYNPEQRLTAIEVCY
jgi:hypothetical protein